MTPLFGVFLCLLFWCGMCLLFPWPLLLVTLILCVLGAVIGARSGVY